MYERFTDRARRVMQLANQLAQQFNHEFIGTEHLFLALVKIGSGVAATALKHLGIDLRKVHDEIVLLVQPGAISKEIHPIDATWLWRNDFAALKLAQQIGQHRRWDELPKLADALEQVGCTDAAILSHCRQAVKHSDECWVVNLLLAHVSPPGDP